ncbi:unnamed protein product [Ixodes persulcatus]
MRAGCALTALLALGLVAFVASAGPRRPHNRAFAKAAQHEQLVWTEGACRRPQPRVLCLKALRPNDTRKYVPHCTILHRCGPDTGCCSTEEEHCQAKTLQAVPLQFLLVQLNADGQSRYEPATLAFDNHTECECRLKNEPIR